MKNENLSFKICLVKFIRKNLLKENYRIKRELARNYGVSRFTIQQAIKNLEEIGIVRGGPRIGNLYP